jgi:hypothetical protein
MISDQQEQMMSEARGKARQNKQTPLLINRENLRLMPNTPLIRKRPNYMPYDGRAGDDEATRRAYVEGRANHRPRVVNSAAEADAFDIGKCTKDELVTFAMGEYGVMLDIAKDIRTLRKEFMAQVDALDAATSNNEAMS